MVETATGRKPVISLVVAMAANGVIGRDGDLPWRLSTDLKRFKALTIDKPIVMGRKTWDSFPIQPLPRRTNIVITRDRSFGAEGAVVAHSISDALDMAAKAPGGDEICVIGGGQVFAETMLRADVLHVTHIDVDVPGDTGFPTIEPETWYKAHEEQVPEGPKDEFASRYVIYRRRQA